MYEDITNTEKLSKLYDDPLDLPDDNVDIEPNVIDCESNDLLTQFSLNIAESLQFPKTTCFLHGLGVISAALNKSFTIDYFGDLPTGLYVVTAQPPSTGKSGINNHFSIPYRIAISDLNQKNKPIRGDYIDRMKLASEQLKKATCEDEVSTLKSEIAELEEKIEDLPIYKAAVTNATPEALETVAFKQKGLFTIVSDESGSILSALGMTYGDSNRPANADMILQGWDGNYFSSARVGRGESEGVVKGAISVIAQDETVRAILEQGKRGNGVSERFLLCMEQNILGERNHLKFKSVDSVFKARYAKLINNIVHSDEIKIKISREGDLFLKQKMQELEPNLADNGKYADNMLRGFVGKMSKQTVKIATVLHAVDNFEESVSNFEVSKKTIERAYKIFMEVTALYVAATSSEGFAGVSAQCEVVRSAFERHLDKGELGVIKINRLLDNIKKSKPWANQSKVTQHFREVIMPIITELKWCEYSTDKGANYLEINTKL